jgi:hypothetical protein
LKSKGGGQTIQRIYMQNFSDSQSESFNTLVNLSHKNIKIFLGGTSSHICMKFGSPDQNKIRSEIFDDLQCGIRAKWGKGKQLQPPASINPFFHQTFF